MHEWTDVNMETHKILVSMKRSWKVLLPMASELRREKQSC